MITIFDTIIRCNIYRHNGRCSCTTPVTIAYPGLAALNQPCIHCGNGTNGKIEEWEREHRRDQDRRQHRPNFNGIDDKLKNFDCQR